MYGFYHFVQWTFYICRSYRSDFNSSRNNTHKTCKKFRHKFEDCECMLAWLWKCDQYTQVIWVSINLELKFSKSHSVMFSWLLKSLHVCFHWTAQTCWDIYFNDYCRLCYLFYLCISWYNDLSLSLPLSILLLVSLSTAYRICSCVLRSSTLYYLLCSVVVDIIWGSLNIFRYVQMLMHVHMDFHLLQVHFLSWCVCYTSMWCDVIVLWCVLFALFDCSSSQLNRPE